MTTDTPDPAELMTAQISTLPERIGGPLIDQIDGEAALRDAMIAPAVAALDRPGAVVEIGRSSHVTIQALTEMAAHLAVTVETTHPQQGTDPLTGAVTAEVTARAVRGDGVAADGHGVASAGESVNGRPRWQDWHAICSMAETRAKSRALTALLMPVIQIASNHEISTAAAETIPPGAAEPAPKSQTPKRRVLAMCGGDKKLAAEMWAAHDGDIAAIAEALEQPF